MQRKGDVMNINRKKWLCGIAACLCFAGSTVPVFADTVKFNITIPGDIICELCKKVTLNFFQGFRNVITSSRLFPLLTYASIMVSASC